MVILTQAEYQDRVHGGWLGKLIGTAVGRPTDGQKQVQEIAGYPGKLSEASAAWSEGTDFQAVWLRALQAAGPKLTDDDLIGGWLRHIAHTGGEYACARANFRRGVNPPISGAFDNPFRESLGALARAELWGMLTPGDPEQAAWFTRRDAMLDHSGAGIESAIWLAGMVSGAFVEREVARLIEMGLGLIPEDGRVERAVRDVVRWHADHGHWGRTREMLLRSYSSDDVRDSVVAAGVIALALLQGRGDFARSVLSAAGCGWSTAATAGAAGAVVGVMLGEGGLPADWRAGLRGEASVSGNVIGLPRSLPPFWAAEQICEMGRIVVRSECGGRVQLGQEPAEEEPKLPAPDASSLLRQLAIGPYVTSHRRGPLRIQVDYDGRPTIGYDLARRLTVALSNTANRTLEVQVRLAAPAGFVVAAASESVTLTEATMVSFVLTCTAPRGIARIAPSNPCTLFLSVDDGAEFTVPVTLVGESLWYASGPYGSFDDGHAPEDPAVLSGERSLEGEAWRRLSVAEPMVNIVSGLEGKQGVYYLATDLLMPMPARARLWIACSDGTRTWLNGGQVWYQHEHRPASPLSADEPEAELREGWNRLVIKMAQCTPRRYLALALKDPAGHILLEAANTEPRRV
jgi:ADP-ribosylglycohydrolase